MSIILTIFFFLHSSYIRVISKENVYHICICKINLNLCSILNGALFCTVVTKQERKIALKITYEHSDRPEMRTLEHRQNKYENPPHKLFGWPHLLDETANSHTIVNSIEYYIFSFIEQDHLVFWTIPIKTGLIFEEISAV